MLAEWNNVRLGSIAVEGANPDVDTPEDLAAARRAGRRRMKRDLAQLVIFAAWFVVLWRYAPLRNLVPRHAARPDASRSASSSGGR